MSTNGSPKGNGRTQVVDPTVELPTDHVHELHDIVPDALVPEVSRRGNPVARGFRRFRADLRGLGLLRLTPYGMTPALIFGGVHFFQIFDNLAFRVAGPEIVRQTGISIPQIINLSITVVVITIAVAPFAGWWADRHRRVPLFGIGTIVSGLFSMLSSRQTTTATLGTARAVDEVSNVAADVPSFSLLADYYPPETRGRAYAMLGTLSRAGRILAIIVVGPMVLHWGFRTTFVIVGAPIVVMGVLALFKLREPVRGYFERRATGAPEEVAKTEDEPQSFTEGWRATFAVRTLRRLFIGDLVNNMTDIIAIIFPFFLAERYGLDVAEISWLLLPPTVFAIVGGVFGAGLIDRFSRKNPGRVLTVFGAFTILSGIGYLGYSVRPPLVLLVAFTCLVYFGGALVGPALQSVYSQVVPPAVRTQGLQLTTLAAIPGIIFGGTLFERVLGEYGYQSVFLVGAPFLFVGGLIQMTAGAFFESDRRNALAQAVAAEEWRRTKEAGNKKLLVCRDVDVAYDGVQVLFNVDFDVEEGEIIALLGTNGAGKSTLLKAISGTQEASAGGIVFDGRDITHMPPNEIASRGVVTMPGGKGVFPGLTVRENLLLGNWLVDDEDDVRSRVAEAYDVFPVLRERADALAGTLSGGEQQQLSLAQAFMMRPKMLLIDELSLGLSPAVVGQLLEVVKEIHKRGVTIVVVEQSVNVALNLAQRAIFMEKGEVKFFGDTAELLQRPDILRAVYVKGTGALTTGGTASALRNERAQRMLELGDARPILEVDGVSKRFGGIVAVDDVSFELRDGEVLGVIGPNGSGKTTMFDVISGFLPADAGRVRLEGVDVTDLSPEAHARAGLVRRFQDARLFPSLTVMETLLVALEHRMEVKSTALAAIRAPQARRAERRIRAQADRLVELLSLDAYRDKFVKELSTGLRRIVDLACVLAAEPKVLLLDEPSSGIAQSEAEALGPLLRRVRFETGCSILIIEHDMPLISTVSDELIALDQGQLVLRGTPEVVLNDERVVESYLGGSEAAVRRSGSLT